MGDRRPAAVLRTEADDRSTITSSLVKIEKALDSGGVKDRGRGNVAYTCVILQEATTVICVFSRSVDYLSWETTALE